MKITNRFGLPSAIVNAINAHEYDKGNADFSATELLDPPRLSALKDMHADELESDASEMIYALLGSLMHELLEKSEPSVIFKQLTDATGTTQKKSENRLFAHIEGSIISGKFDRVSIRAVTMQDYKFMSVYEVMNGLKPEKIAQVNIYNWLLHKNGYDGIKNLEVVAMFRDWSKRKAKRGQHPPAQVQRIKVEMWPIEQTEKFLLERIRLHRAARVKLPECTHEERWAKPDVWAIMKPNRKSALKLLNVKPDAAEIAGFGGTHAEYRPAESVRCEDYCIVSEFCEQFKRSRNGG